MALVVALVLTVLKNHEQRQRIALLGAHLQRFQLEKLIEGLTEGYLRAFGEADAQRHAWLRLRHAVEPNQSVGR